MSGVNNVPALLFALSGSVRSNGVLNAGYYGFKALHQSYYAMYVKKRPHVSAIDFLYFYYLIFTRVKSLR